MKDMKNTTPVQANKTEDSGKKRRLLYGSFSIVLTAVVVVAILLVNIFLGYLGDNINLSLDLTQNKVFSITNKTETVVSGLNQDVYIYTMFSGNDTDKTLNDILNQYKPLSEHVKVENVDPLLNPGFAKLYSNVSVTPATGDVVVTSADKKVYRVIFSKDLYTYDADGDLSQVNIESKITTAIVYVTDEDRKTAYMMTGHGEPDIGTMDGLRDILEGENMEIKTEKMDVIAEEIQEGDILVVVGPQSDLTDDERELMKSYVEAGGLLMMNLDNELTEELGNFKSILKLYGVGAPNGMIVEGNRSYYAMPYTNYIVPSYSTHDITDSLSAKGVSVMFPYSVAPLVVSQPLPENDITIYSLLNTSSSSYMKDADEMTDMDHLEKDPDDLEGPFSVGLAITRPYPRENKTTIDTRIVLFNSVNLVRYCDSLNAYSNGDLIRNSIAWLKGDSAEEMYIRGKTVGDAVLYFTNSSQVLWTILLIWPVPVVIILVVGIVIFIRRRHL